MLYAIQLLPLSFHQTVGKNAHCHSTSGTAVWGPLRAPSSEKQMWQVCFKKEQQFTAELVLRSLSKWGNIYSRKSTKSGRHTSVALEQRVVRRLVLMMNMTEPGLLLMPSIRSFSCITVPSGRMIFFFWKLDWEKNNEWKHSRLSSDVFVFCFRCERGK